MTFAPKSIFLKLGGKLTALLILLCGFLAQIGCNGSSGTGSNADSTATPAKWKMGIALYSFNRHSFTAALDKVDSAGIKYVEGFSFYMLGKEFADSTLGSLSPTGIARMQQIMKDKGISMESLYAEGGNVEEWKRYFEIAKAVGAKFLTSEPARNQWDIADSLAGVYGIPVAIHEHGRGHSAYWHPDSVLAAMKGHPNFSACADLGHWARSGLDPVECLKKLKGHILGIHLKDIDSLNNINAADVTVGTGVINFPAVVRELRDQNYTGMIYVECEHNMENNLADVIQSLKYFNGL
ncbi:sugar phosphate isomerase/epimerase [Chitinophaga silvatica]|uniref:Sugar phosphate isomerase/epimerase n=1 Tax=Chitinophaga silvatica TaxID=2282649 RepID=A0A3E1Y5P8_9BACT|nr:sugar phosphate isomerase/epimerase [Chitinophaga silvatica]RFS20058.1 sugar phosphate isomerase/epimerase [Chitinophaga silvatica]